MTDPKILLQCAWIYSEHLAPGEYTGGDRSLLPDGAVLFQNGRILAVGPAQQLRKQDPDARAFDAGNSILLPGLINAHTHLELSACSHEPRSETFPDWIISLGSRLGPDRDFIAHTRHGIAESLRFGTTTIGDISQQMHLTRPLLAESPIRAVSYGEVLGLAKLYPRAEELFPRALDTACATDKLHIGLTPHSPYTIDEPTYRKCLAAARELNLPLATHLAELPYEEEFLRNHSGPLRDLYERLNSWSEPVATFTASPIRFAHAIGLLDYPTLLAHVNYCDDDELNLLTNGKASVVYCPRTHHYFNHPPHRFRDMLARGINVAVATDSCASSPNLNLMDDLRFVHTLAPEIPAEELFKLITTSAARALNLHHQIGSLTPGHHADFTLFPVRTNDPLLELLESPTLPTQLWISGIKMNQPQMNADKRG